MKMNNNTEVLLKQRYNWIKKYIQKTAKLRWSFILETASEKNLCQIFNGDPSKKNSSWYW